MSNLFWLTDEQMERLKPFFPKSHCKPRVEDRHVLSGIIFINPNGLRWCDAPREYGPPKTLYNRWKRWGDMGVFARMMVGLAPRRGRGEGRHDRRDLSEGAPHGFKPAGEKGGPDDKPGRLIGRTKGGLKRTSKGCSRRWSSPKGFSKRQRPCSATSGMRGWRGLVMPPRRSRATSSRLIGRSRRCSTVSSTKTRAGWSRPMRSVLPSWKSIRF